MPTIASVMDEFRKHFGDGVKCTYASENGITKGVQRPCEGVTVPSPFTTSKRREAAIPTTVIKQKTTRRP